MSNEGASGVAAEGRFHIGEPAKWVTGFSTPPPEAGAHTDDSPTDQLLVERQLFPKRRAHYSRHAQRLNNAQGVEALSQVRLHFDPAIEQLVVHSVRVWRDGVATEHADAARFKLLQREDNLERQIYDGRVSALLLLEDVRPGDVIDVASTRTGDHPQLASHFFTAFATDYPVPVTRWSASVLVGEDSPLRWRCTPEEIEPASRELKGGWTLHRWSKSDLPACEFEPNTPGWHLQGSAIEFSDFGDWAEVARWVAVLWGKAEVPEELKEIAQRIATEAADEVGRADLALAFVRDEIRYLGLEDGIGSLQPCPVGDVLRRRFGDCKDKSRLLCLLLRMLKIPASPMLVHTVAGKAVEDMLPSPGAFDHVIVCAKVDGKAAWIDPTRRNLAKSVAELPPPHYGVALPVSAKATGLRKIPETPLDAALLVVKETISVKDRESPAVLTVEQTASGFEAEHLREVVGSLGKSRYRELREAQLRETYPKAKAVGDWEVDVDPDSLSPSTREHYEVSGFVQEEGNSSHSISFGPNSLRGRLAGTPHADDSREAPWALPYPCRIRHEIHVDLPSPIADMEESHQVDSETFGYKTSLRVDGDQAHAVYRYWSKSDHVRPDQLEAYSSDYERLGKLVNAVLPLDKPLGVPARIRQADGAPRKRRSGSSRSRHDGAKRKKLFNAVGTIGVAAIVIGVFASTKDHGPPKPPRASNSAPAVVDSAAFQAIYGNREDGGALGAQTNPDDIPDSAVPSEGDGFLPIGENPATGTTGDEIKASLLDFDAPVLSDQPEDPKYQDLKNLDLKF